MTTLCASQPALLNAQTRCLGQTPPCLRPTLLPRLQPSTFTTIEHFPTAGIHTGSKRIRAHFHSHYRRYQNSHTNPLYAQKTINLHRRNIIKILPLLPAINRTFTTIIILSRPFSPRPGITDYTGITNTLKKLYYT